MAEGTGGNNGSYSPNATVVTTGGTGGIYQPKTLISAISQIQQFFVIESKGQRIPGEFFTLEDTIGFFKVGARSGFNEGIFLFIFFPIFKFYLLPFVLT